MENSATLTTTADTKSGANTASNVAYIAVFTAFIWVMAFGKFEIGGVGVPITLQTLAIAITGFILGPLRGFLATLLYVLLGLAGLPVFAGGAGGPAVLAEPSAGYIIAFPFFALLCGFVAKNLLPRARGAKLWALLFVGGIVSSFLVVHTLGIVGISINAQISLQDALLADMPFWPGDAIKNFVAAGIAVLVHRAFPDLLARRQR